MTGEALDVMALVGGIRLVKTLPCLADPGKLIVIGEPDAALDGVLRSLVQLCVGPDGPLPDLEV